MKNTIFSYPAGMSQLCSQLASNQTVLQKIAQLATQEAPSLFLSLPPCVLCLSDSLSETLHPLATDTYRTMIQSCLVQLLIVANQLQCCVEASVYQPQLHYIYFVSARRSLKLASYLCILVGNIYYKKKQEKLTFRFHKIML